MKNIIIKSLCAFTIATLFFACKKENNTDKEPSAIPALDGLTMLKSGYANGASAKVEIWAEKNFFAGYNRLTVVLYDSANNAELLPSAQISFLPRMNMSTGMHAAPVENPEVQAKEDVFPGAVIFQMPTITDCSWQLIVQVHNNKNNKDGEALFDITVDNPGIALVKTCSTLSPDSCNLILALVKPDSAIVGINDIEFVIFRKINMMSLPADDSYSMEIDPQMPSMGHGSPNNINPTNSGNGHYKGKVNFIMTGWWRVNVLLKKGEDIISQDLYFDITF